MLMDQKKLDEAKRLLKTTNETETIDAALDEIAFRHGLVDGMRALKRSGGLWSGHAAYCELLRSEAKLPTA